MTGGKLFDSRVGLGFSLVRFFSFSPPLFRLGSFVSLLVVLVNTCVCVCVCVPAFVRIDVFSSYILRGKKREKRKKGRRGRELEATKLTSSLLQPYTLLAPSLISGSNDLPSLAMPSKAADPAPVSSIKFGPMPFVPPFSL